MSGFAFHPEALNDLNDVWDFIAADSIDAADRIVEEIFDGIRALVPFPRQGHRRPDLTSRPLRFARVRDYLIAYAPEENPLLVIRNYPWTPESACHGCHSEGPGAVAGRNR